MSDKTNPLVSKFVFVLTSIADEIIALAFVFFFLGVGATLALMGRMDDLKTYASVMSPFIGTITTFYYMRKKR